MNTYFKINNLIELYYPIPDRHRQKVVYCRVLNDGSKAFYYDSAHDILCEVDKVEIKS